MKNLLADWVFFNWMFGKKRKTEEKEMTDDQETEEKEMTDDQETEEKEMTEDQETEDKKNDINEKKRKFKDKNFQCILEVYHKNGRISSYTVEKTLSPDENGKYNESNNLSFEKIYSSFYEFYTSKEKTEFSFEFRTGVEVFYKEDITGILYKFEENK